MSARRHQLQAHLNIDKKTTTSFFSLVVANIGVPI